MSSLADGYGEENCFKLVDRQHNNFEMFKSSGRLKYSYENIIIIIYSHKNRNMQDTEVA